MKLVVGLGNPGEEYAKTRHNAGRIIVQILEDKFGSKGVKYLTPDTFMNNSGKAVGLLVKSKKDLANLIVVYDDIDLPFGKIKLSFNRSSGGHNGVESVIKAVKSREFVRVRIGICPTTPTGKMKKPQGEDKVHNFLLGEFKKEEFDKLKKLAKPISAVIEVIYTESLQKAMSLYN